MPEHSIVNVTSCRGRALMSASVRVIGFLTRPSISSFHVLASMTGRLKCAIEKNLSFGVIQEFEVLPDELILDHLGNRVRRQLIEPSDDFLAGSGLGRRRRVGWRRRPPGPQSPHCLL